MIYLDYSANTPVDEAVLQRFCEMCIRDRSCTEAVVFTRKLVFANFLFCKNTVLRDRKSVV